MVRLFQILIIVFSIQINFSQEEKLELSSSVDSTSIKVGQQFNYIIKAESEKIVDLVFPEKFNFSPFEIAEEFPVDTSFFKGKKTLTKKFKLTNFEEGLYSIKPQQILFQNKAYFTDSFAIEVRTIKVDTVSKKFFDIKEIILNKEQRTPLSKYLFSILILLVGSLIVFLLYKKFKNHVYNKNDFKTPFENAIDELVSLEKETLDSQNDFKLFYSKLTQIAKEYLENEEELRKLASSGQSPSTMVISCCDSRIHATSIFGADEGEFFIHRNIANLVPPYSLDVENHGTSAAIEYAIKELKVRHLIILGHQDCGGIKNGYHMHSNSADFNYEFINKWASIILPAFNKIQKNVSVKKQLNQLEEESIKVSIDNLFNFPFIKKTIEDNNLLIHGLIHDIGSGNLKFLNPVTQNFENF